MRILKIGGIVLGGLVLLLIVLLIGGYAYLTTIDLNDHKGDIIALVKQETGRDLKIDGDLDLDFSFSPKLRVEDVRFANAAWGSRQDMLRLRSAEIDMSLLPLLTATVQLDRIAVKGLDVLIETDAAGQINTEMGGASDPAARQDIADDETGSGSSGGASFGVIVRDVNFENLLVTYKDGVAETTKTLVVDEATAVNGAFPDDPFRVAIRAALNGAPITLEGHIGPLDGGDSASVDMRAEAFGVVSTASGTIADAENMRGVNLALSTKTDDLSASLSALGEAIPEARLDGIAATPFSFTTQLTDTPDGAVSLNDMRLKVGNSDLSGEISVTPVLPLLLRADLTSTLINTDDVIAASTKQSTPSKTDEPADKTAQEKKAEKLFPTSPFPLDDLRKIDAQITLRADKIVAFGVVSENISVDLSLRDGKLTSPVSADIAGGTFKADTSLDGSGSQGLSISRSVTVKDVRLGQLLNDALGRDILVGGPTNIDIELSGSGRSVAALMAGLNGRIVVQVGAGKVNNAYIDLLGGDLFSKGLPAVFKEKKDTELTCAVINAKVTDGLVSIENGIGMETSAMLLSGTGQVNLKDETLELAVSPKMNQALGIGLGGLAEMVQVTGTLANPGIGLNTEEAVKNLVSVGAAIGTGGLSLLGEKMLSNATEDTHPCATAMGLKPAPKAAASEPEQPAATDDQQKQPSLTDQLKGGALKGLFGD